MTTHMPDVSDREIVIKREFDAPRDLVFRTWTETKHLDKWWGPNGFTTATLEMDFRPGGKWRYRMYGPDGTEYPNRIRYIEIAAPERLVYEHGDDDEDSSGAFHVTVTFEEQSAGKTVVTMRSLFNTAEERDYVVREYGAIESGKETMERLAKYLADKADIQNQGGTTMSNDAMVSRVENDNVLVLERIFDAPRELVFRMFKEAEHLKHWWGPRCWEIPVCNVDFRPGGVWHYCMKCVDPNQGDFFGMESWGKAVYKEISEPDKIVYMDYFSDAEGNSNDSLPSTEVTVEFVDLGGKTKLINRGEYVSAEALKTVMDMGMLEGITQTWDRLEERLNEAKQA